MESEHKKRGPKPKYITEDEKIERKNVSNLKYYVSHKNMYLQKMHCDTCNKEICRTSYTRHCASANHMKNLA